MNFKRRARWKPLTTRFPPSELKAQAIIKEKMLKCLRCGAENFADSLFCDECGATLKVYETMNQTNATIVDETKTMITEDATTFAVSPSFVSNRNSGASARLVIERGKSAGKEFLLTTQEISIGRWDADNGVFPDVDLDADDPEAKISRRHARIKRSGGTFSIEDLGSTNGTFINRGRRLLAGTSQNLNDGDEIIVGKTFLRFQIIR
ncbi:MAG: FHA domain-containing protein [Pyrinomonadaceae bacterium]|nr:FHA domain-containing protein [Pyrinomonadaceae bacterium]